MKVIKLDAIDSTNDFMKRLLMSQQVDNYVVITSNKQTKGRGQMGSVWESEAGKNLTMSVLIKDFLKDINHIFNLNIVVSLSIMESLELLRIPKLSIKWPNDIMSGNRKIGGILIENNIKSDGTISSIVGLGLNVNQINFNSLPKASSLAVVCNRNFDIDELLFQVVESIKKNIAEWEQNSSCMWENYSNKLFKKGIPMTFQTKNDQKFTGIIVGVTSIGKLKILLENDKVSEYEVKEILFLF